MARQEGGIVAKGIELFLDHADERRMIAAGQIGAAYATAEQYASVSGLVCQNIYFIYL